MNNQYKVSNWLETIFSAKPPTDLIPSDEMESLVNRKLRTILSWHNKSNFPAPIRQGKSIVGWRRDEYERWLKLQNSDAA